MRERMDSRYCTICYIENWLKGFGSMIRGNAKRVSGQVGHYFWNLATVD
jgi:hypothetical protein